MTMETFIASWTDSVQPLADHLPNPIPITSKRWGRVGSRLFLPSNDTQYILQSGALLFFFLNKLVDNPT